jgi:large subunit ribosomal protein L24
MAKLKIKKGDSVKVIAGSDKGKTGVVLAVDSKNMKIKVQDVKVMTHYDKKEGLLKKEGFFDYSNVQLVESKKAPAKAKKETKAKAKTKK